jgi:hypothetical protein
MQTLSTLRDGVVAVRWVRIHLSRRRVRLAAHDRCGDDDLPPWTYMEADVGHGDDCGIIRPGRVAYWWCRVRIHWATSKTLPDVRYVMKGGRHMMRTLSVLF